MRKILSCILVVFMLIRISSVFVAAAPLYGWSPTEYQNDHSELIPFTVEQVDTVHRYAVDVEYQDMTIYVKSAIWDVNAYQYDVEMKHIADGAQVSETPDKTPFSFLITVINHSDLPVNAAFSANVETGLQASISREKITLQEVDPNQKQPFRDSTQISITPDAGWEVYINSLIVRGVPDDYICPVGSVNLVITKN